LKIMRFFLSSLAAAALFMPVAAQAQTVNFIGFTEGDFNGSAFAATDTLGGLTFNGGTFNVTTADGFAAVGDAPMSTDTFGSITLTDAPFVYGPALGDSPNEFNLRVTFTAPPGAGSQIVMAEVRGTVEADGSGGARLDFNNAYIGPNSYTGGSYFLQIDDRSVTPGNTVSLTGTILADVDRVPVVPEPASLALLLPGLIPLGVALRRRKSS